MPTPRMTTAEKKAAFIVDRRKQIQGLKSPTDAQRLILQLEAKSGRTGQDQTRLGLLWDAEYAADQAAKLTAKARKKASAIVNADKHAERKARDHALYQSAGLLIIAGLVDTTTGHPTRDRGALLGAMLALAKTDDPAKWAAWKSAGDAELARRETT